MPCTQHSHNLCKHLHTDSFGRKWVRLLLGREFHLEDVMNLWDAILSDGPNLALLEYICVAMLMYIREDCKFVHESLSVFVFQVLTIVCVCVAVLKKEQTGCLQRLMRYPPVENVNLFVERALELRDPASAPLSDPLLQVSQTC